MHGRVHPNYCQITILLVVDPLSSWNYLMMTHSIHVAGDLPIETLVARLLPTNKIIVHAVEQSISAVFVWSNLIDP